MTRPKLVAAVTCQEIVDAPSGRLCEQPGAISMPTSQNGCPSPGPRRGSQRLSFAVLYFVVPSSELGRELPRDGLVEPYTDNGS
jgi:hypothetical protein